MHKAGGWSWGRRRGIAGSCWARLQWRFAPQKTAITLAVLCVVAAPALVQAQRSDKLVKAATLLSRDKVHPGEKFQAAVLMDIHKGYHINSHKPSMDYLIATDLKVKPVKGLVVKATVYPKDKARKFPFSPTPLKVYEGKQPILLTVVADKTLKPGKYAIPANLRVQACSEEACYGPATVKVSIPVEVVPASVKTKAINPDVFGPKGATPKSASGAKAAATTELGKRIHKSGLLLTFVYIFLGGLALNLTPCVYPLIPITVGYFGGQSEGRPSRTFTLALFYVLGIAITYSTLGVISGMAGTLMGNLLQNPIVLLFVAAVLVALALSMFGLYEIQPPQFIRQRAQAKKGNTGALAMGLVVGIVAAPCLAPVLGWLLTYVAITRNPVMGFWMFFTLAIGMGLPYLFLGTFAGSVKSLPRSGVWMVWVKKLFGTILLGATIYVISPLLPQPIERLIFTVYLITGGLYLGWMEASGKNLAKFTVSKRMIGTLIMAAGLWVMVQNGSASPGVQWTPYDGKHVATARQQGKPVIIDFYADWCFDCRRLDSSTYADPKVVAEARRFVMLKADLTEDKDPKVGELWKSYDIQGLPTVVFLDTAGEERRDLRLTGFEAAGKFLKRMSQG